MPLGLNLFHFPMHAQRLLVREFGTPAEKLILEDFTTTPLESSQVLIKVSASPINPADINFIQGNYGVRPELPSSVGLEGSGVVIQSNSSTIKQGDSVIFIQRVGAWSSHVVCNASDVIVIPSTVDPLQAAMLKVNPMTAWQLLTAYRTLSAGDTIVQNAANSGVGQCVIQVARQLGLTTLNLVRSEHRISQIQAIGSTFSFLDNADAKENILRSIGEDRLPRLAFNAVGGNSALRLMDCLADQGDHITYGAMSMRSLKIPNKFLIFKRITLRGLWVTKDIAAMEESKLTSIYCKLANWVEQKKLVQPIDQTYSIEDYKEALEHHSTPDKNGKILFTFFD